MRPTIIVLLLATTASCTTVWEIPDDPPRSCRQLCSSWNMELAGMVGVGDAKRGASVTGSAYDPAATACICQTPGTTQTALLSAGAATALAAPITAQQQAAAQQQQQQQQQFQPKY